MNAEERRAAALERVNAKPPRRGRKARLDAGQEAAKETTLFDLAHEAHAAFHRHEGTKGDMEYFWRLAVRCEPSPMNPEYVEVKLEDGTWVTVSIVRRAVDDSGALLVIHEGERWWARPSEYRESS